MIDVPLVLQGIAEFGKVVVSNTIIKLFSGLNFYFCPSSRGFRIVHADNVYG